MSGDREQVEELESRIAELEATVRGLTEELVDATERIRLLENGEESGASGGGAADPADLLEGEVSAEDVTGGENAGEAAADDGGGARESADAGAEAALSADTPKDGEGEESTNGEESGSGDDIIVA